jgi:hypothetical protein
MFTYSTSSIRNGHVLGAQEQVPCTITARPIHGALGHVTISESVARGDSPHLMSGAWCSCGAGSLGGTVKSLYGIVRTTVPELVVGSESKGCESGPWHQLGRSPLHLDCAATRGLASRESETVCHLGVDKKAFRQGDTCVTVVDDQEKGICFMWRRGAK